MNKEEASQFLVNNGVTHLKVVRDPVGYPEAVTVGLVEALQTEQIVQMQFERAVFETALGLKEGAVLGLANHTFQQLLAELVQSAVKVETGIAASLIAH